jgi:hypothetical protein
MSLGVLMERSDTVKRAQIVFQQGSWTQASNTPLNYPAQALFDVKRQPSHLYGYKLYIFRANLLTSAAPFTQRRASFTFVIEQEKEASTPVLSGRDTPNVLNLADPVFQFKS